MINVEFKITMNEKMLLQRIIEGMILIKAEEDDCDLESASNRKQLDIELSFCEERDLLSLNRKLSSIF